MVSSSLLAFASLVLAASSQAAALAVTTRSQSISVCAQGELEICGTTLLGNSVAPQLLSSPSKPAPAANVHPAAGGAEDHPSKRLTNAERLARGLPPAAPHRRFDPTGITANDDPQPSAAPMTNYHGIVQVLNTADSSVLGYISKNSLNMAQLAYDADVTNGLIVDFSVPTANTETEEVEISTENQDTGYSLLSLIQGRDDTDSTIAPDSYQYGYFGGSAHTDAGATPQNVPNSYTQVTGLSRTAESSVWTFDATTMALAPQWINPDDSAPTTMTFAQSTALYFGGDAAAFNARYPAPVTNVEYVFVSL